MNLYKHGIRKYASIRHDGYIKYFGSDLSGDAIDFVMHVKNCSFLDSI